MNSKTPFLLSFLIAPFIWTLAATSAEPPAKFKVGEFEFARPEAWEWVEPTSSMRKAELKIVDAKNKQTAEVVFFAGFGGGVQANVDRWFGQFEGSREQIGAKVESVTPGSRKVTFASAQGTYLSGMPGRPRTPLKDHALLGAIIESPQGDVFIRMTGPIPLVQSAAEAFKKMVVSAVK